MTVHSDMQWKFGEEITDKLIDEIVRVIEGNGRRPPPAFSVKGMADQFALVIMGILCKATSLEMVLMNTPQEHREQAVDIVQKVMNKMTPNRGEGYSHAEAFCLMRYQCAKCKKTENLWNSRDGVTPFGVSCRECDGTMSHVFWNLDRCVPDYKPPVGMRVFIDLTEEKHKEYMTKRVDAFWDHPEMPMSANFVSKKQAIDALCETYKEGEPDVVTVEENDERFCKATEGQEHAEGDDEECQGDSD